MPRISVYVTVPDKGQKFLAYLDRRVHHTVKDFKLYLGQSIQIEDPHKRDDQISATSSDHRSLHGQSLRQACAKEG